MSRQAIRTGPVLVAVDDAEAVQPGASRTVDDDAPRRTCGLGPQRLSREASELLGERVAVSGPPLFEPAFEGGLELALLLADCDARRGD